MTKSKLRVESLDVQKKLIRITLTESFNLNQDTTLLYQTIVNLAKIKQLRLLLDIAKITLPNTSFIAFLVEIASMIKRNGGDLYILNLTETARINLVTFSPLSFLRVISSEAELNQHSDQSVIPESLQSDDREADTNAEKQAVQLKDEFSIREMTDLPEQENDINAADDQIIKDVDFEELLDVPSAKVKESKNERIVVHSREDQLYKISDFAGVLAEQAGFDHTEVARIKLSIYEAAHNIIEHAYQFDPDKFVELTIKFDEHKFVITLIDRGKSFEYDPNRNYDALEAAEERRTGGFGLFIIRRSMDDVKYETNPIWGNRLTLTKNIP